MSGIRANTLCIGAKTFNLSQVNSVSVQSNEVVDPNSVWTVYVLVGVASWVGLPHLLGAWSFILLLVATFPATQCASQAIQARKYRLFRLAFDMSSGSVSAFETRDESEALRMRDDIIKGMETGILPDYLRGNS